MKNKVIGFALLSFLCFVCNACQHGNSAKMIGDLQGGSPPDAARKQLKGLGFDSRWTQKMKTNSDDPRPRHDFIESKGPFSDLGITGQLELTFYNDRLMEAQFVPNESERYFKLLSDRLGKLPEAPGKQRQISAEVSLSYYRDAGGSVRFYWEFLPVSKEWHDWVSMHSSIFLSCANRNS